MKDINIAKAPRTFHKHLAALLQRIPQQVRANLQDRPGLNYGNKLETTEGPLVTVGEHLDEDLVDFEHDLRSPQDDWIERLHDETPVCPVCGKPMAWMDDWDADFSRGSNVSDTYCCADSDCGTTISYTFDEARRIRITLRKLG